jgi:hypothetical protein
LVVVKIALREIPHPGGFRLERRRARTLDGTLTFTECFVPKWEIDDLMQDQPCARQPRLHRIVADCPPEKDAILDLAGRFGLLSASIAVRPQSGKPVPASAPSPEPMDLWRREIRELKAVGDLWDRIAAGDRRGEELLERKLTGGLARAPFHLTAVRENGSGFRMRYRPATLRAALWQRMAGEVTGQLLCVRCPAPRCGRWFVKGDSRSDGQFCSKTCKVRAFRKQRSTHSLEHVTSLAPGER